jgi:dTMP kinase
VTAAEHAADNGERTVAGYRSLFRKRNYRFWFTSSLASSLGDWIGIFALQVLVISLAEPGSRVALFGLGGIMMARLLPSIFFGPFAGVISDRYDRRNLMVVANGGRCLLFVALALWHNLPVLFTLTIVIECLSLIYMSAKDASLPAVVDRSELAYANQMNLLVTYGPMPFGAAIATLMTAVAALVGNLGLGSPDPIVLALLFNAAGFFIGGLLIAQLRLPKRPHSREAAESSDGMLDELKTGLRYINEIPLIRSLIIGLVGVFFGAGVVITLGPEFVRTSLGRSETAWFSLMSLVGSGMLLGLISAPFIRKKFQNEHILPTAMVAAGLIALITAWAPSFNFALVMGTLLGAAAGISFVTGYTVIHEHTEDSVRARTFAAFYTGTRIAMFSALGLAPFMAGAVGLGEIEIAGRQIELSGIRVTIFFAGAVALLSALLAGKGMFDALEEED